MLNKDIVITLENNMEYGVVETQIINSNQYALLINMKNKEDVRICKVVKENNDLGIITVEGEEYDIIYPLFYAKMKKYLESLINN